MGHKREGGQTNLILFVVRGDDASAQMFLVAFGLLSSSPPRLAPSCCRNLLVILPLPGFCFCSLYLPSSRPYSSVCCLSLPSPVFGRTKTPLHPGSLLPIFPFGVVVAKGLNHPSLLRVRSLMKSAGDKLAADIKNLKVQYLHFSRLTQALIGSRVWALRHDGASLFSYVPQGDHGVTIRLG